MSCLLHTAIVSCLLHTDYNCNRVLSVTYWLQRSWPVWYILTTTVVACLIHTDYNGRGLSVTYWLQRSWPVTYWLQRSWPVTYWLQRSWPVFWQITLFTIDWFFFFFFKLPQLTVFGSETRITDGCNHHHPLQQSARQQQQRLWGKHFENVVDVKLPCGQPAARNSMWSSAKNIRFDPQT